LEKRGNLVSLNECGAEPSANNFLPPPSTIGSVKMLIASTRSLASSAGSLLLRDIAEVKRLKQEDGPHLVTQGSTELVHALEA